MASVFDLEAQHEDIDRKILAGLERLTHVYRSMLWETATSEKLSPIQLQVLVYLLYHRPGLRRVSQLAREFNMTQATVSDAVSSLETKGLIHRAPWAGDARILTLGLTPAGIAMAERVAGWANTMLATVTSLPAEDKPMVWRFLMSLIEALIQQGVIAGARMCVTCRYFARDAHAEGDAPHHCRLLDIPLAPAHLRLDCPEHETALTPA